MTHLRPPKTLNLVGAASWSHSDQWEVMHWEWENAQWHADKVTHNIMWLSDKLFILYFSLLQGMVQHSETYTYFLSFWGDHKGSTTTVRNKNSVSPPVNLHSNSHLWSLVVTGRWSMYYDWPKGVSSGGCRPRLLLPRTLLTHYSWVKSARERTATNSMIPQNPPTTYCTLSWNHSYVNTLESDKLLSRSSGLCQAKLTTC